MTNDNERSAKSRGFKLLIKHMTQSGGDLDLVGSNSKSVGANTV